MKRNLLPLCMILLVLAQLLFVYSGPVFGIPANPSPINYTQPDGSRLTILLKGDEFIHWAETTDGYTLMSNSQGAYEYAAPDYYGRLVFSGITANDPGKRTPAEGTFLNTISKGLFFSSDQVREMKDILKNGGAPDAPLSGGFPTTGTRNLVMILANFSNTSTTYTQANFNNYMNQVNYNSTGSFKDYYLEVSYGQLTVNTTVTVWVTLPNTHDYYGPDTKWGEFALAAVTAANNQTSINFANFDNNLDGVVDGVAIIHQGQGQEETGNVLDIWSHSWELSSAGFSAAQRTFDGVQVDSYTTMPERNSTGMGTIGVMCHEFGHNLGAPDFYDTDYSTGGSYTGTGRWDLMAGGSWNGTSGTKPAHPNAWVKASFGWTTPVVMTTSQTRLLRNAQVYTDVVRYNTTTANEYFLCENRQQTGFDVGIPGHGLIIYHVDGVYISSHSWSNDINATSHQGLYPVCANATGNPTLVYGTINSTGCPFPGASSKTSFTDATTPHSHSWAGANTSLPITGITENNTTKEITFTFGNTTAPNNPGSFTATSVSISQINLAWTKNASSNPVMVAYSTTSAFGTPVSGTSYSAGTVISGGGQVLYTGPNTSYSHTGLNPNATYYYKAWSVATGAVYSSGLTANATTTCSTFLPVSVSIVASANPVCAGTSVTFTATPVNGGTSPTYQWKKNAVNVSSATNATYTYIPVNGNVITCQLTSNALCVTGNPALSNAITMTVNPQLIVGSIAASQIICANTIPALLTATPPSNGTSPVYQWQSSLNNVTFANISGATLLNYQPAALSAKTYFRQIQNAAGTCGGPLPTNIVSITVNPMLPVSVSIAASATNVCAGTSVPFTATPTNGGTTPAYQWKKGGILISGGTNTTYSYVPVNGDVITCQHTSNALCVTGNPALSNAITVTVNPQLIVGSIAANQTICANTIPALLTATTPANGTSPVYQWQSSLNNVTFANIAGATLLNYQPAVLSTTTYFRQVQNSSGTCGGPLPTNFITITVNPSLIVGSIAANQIICANTIPALLTATPPANGTSPLYQWQSSLNNVTFANIAGATLLNYQPAVLATTTYFRQMQNAAGTCGGPLSTNSVSITVNPLLPVSVTIAPSATNVCAGTSVTFTATPTNGGTTPAYQWKKNAVNVGNATNAVFSYVPANGDVITCQLTSNALCTTGNPAISNAVAMTVNPLLPVSVTIAPSATNVCAGTLVTFTATPTNGGTTPAYQWKKNAVNVGNATNATYSYVPANGDVITCQLTSNAICTTGNPATSNAVAMTVNPLLPVSVTIAPSATNVCAGTLVTFTATPTNGGTTPAYQWKKNAVNVGNATNATYSYVPVNGNVITCQLTSNAVCKIGNPALSNAVTMTVNSILPVGVSITASASIVCTGTSVTFAATGSNGGTSPAYLWKKAGVAITGATNATYSYVPLHGDIITCVLTSSLSCATGNPATSNALTMVVKPLLPVSVSITESANPVCAGTLVNYTATPVNGGSTPSYQWKVNANNVNNANNAVFSYAPVNGDVITCQLTSNAQCAMGNPAISNSVAMTVDPLLPVSVSVIASANPVCAGTAVTFKAKPVNGGSNPVYQWKVNGNNVGPNNFLFTYVPVNGDMVSCVLTSNALCATGNPAISRVLTMTVNPLLPMSISVVASANNICAGTFVTFNALINNGGSSPVYKWKKNGINVGTNSPVYGYVPLNNDIIACELTSNAQCATGNPATSNAVIMHVNPLLPVSVTISPSANPVCAGTFVSFVAIPVNGGTNPSFRWIKNGLNIQGATASTYGYIPLANDVISCELTSNAVCPTGNPALSNPVVMTVNPLKPVSVSIAASANPVCAGTQVAFIATPVNGGTNPLYQWKKNGINANNANNATYSYIPVHGDVIACQLTSNVLCATGNPAASNVVIMTVNPLLPVSISIVPSANPVCAGTQVTYSSTIVNGGSNPAYQWRKNGTVISGATNPAYTCIPVSNESITCELTSNAICPTGSPAISNPVTVIVNPLLPVSVLISASVNPVCDGSPVTFTAVPVNGGTNPGYQWKVNGADKTGATNATYTYIPLSGDQVMCVLTSNAVCPVGNPAVSNVVIVTVNPLLPVSITVTASANPVCSGTQITFTSSTVNGGANPLCQWFVNGVPVAGATSQMLTYNLTTPDAVRCQVTSNAVCPTGNPAQSNTINIGLIPELQPGTVSSSQSVCMNTLPAPLTATPPLNGTSPTYQWQSSLNNITFANINGATTTVYQPGPATVNRYYRMLQNSQGTCSGPLPTNIVLIQVYPWSPVSVTISANATQVCYGTAVTYTAVPVNGGSAPVFQWKVNGINVGSNNPVYSYYPVNNDVVSCLLTSNTLCVTGNPALSNRITMTVLPIFQVGSAGANQTICAGETPSALLATSPATGSQPVYQWQSSLNNSTFSNINAATMLSYQPGVLNVTTYYRQIQNSSGTCGGPLPTNTVTITVNPWVPVGVSIVPSDNPFCAGSSVTYTATPGNGGSDPVYSWKVNGITTGTNNPIFSYSPANNDLVTCELTSNAACVTGNPAFSNSVVMVENALNPASISIIASANPVCAGTAVVFSATAMNGGTNPEYQWQINGTNAGTNAPQFSVIPVNGDVITCVLTSNAFCVTGSPATSSPVVMAVNPLLPVGISIAASSNPVCAGMSVTYTVTTVNGGSTPLYQWMKTGASVIGATNATYAYVPANNDLIACVLASNAVCATGNPATSNTIAMIVNPLLPVSVTIIASANNICAGTGVTFTATAVNGGPGPVWQWNKNGVAISGATNANFSYTPLNNDVISCDLTSNAVCPTGNPASSNGIAMVVNPILPVSVSITSSANNVCAGTSVTFTATPVNGGTAPAYQWKKNAINVSNAINATYSYVPVNGDVITCQLTSSALCTTGNPATSNAVTMIVNPLLPVSISVTGSANPVYSGTTVSFSATITNGGTAPVYQWKVNGDNAGTNSSAFAYIPTHGDIVTCLLTSNTVCASGNPATSNSITMVVVTVPANLNLQNLNITDTRCYDATQTITVAGSGTTFTVQSGARVTMIAGQKIRYLAGTKVKKSGYLHGYITTTGQYCMSLPPSMVAVATSAEEIYPVEPGLHVKIYPNPTSGAFTMELTGVEKNDKVRVDLYGMTGEKVMTTDIFGEKKHEFSLSGKPAGIYLIQVVTSQGSVTSRIIKR